MEKNKTEIYCLGSEKFKTKTINVFFCDRLNKETVSYNALIANVLKRGTKNLKTVKDITIKCQELYSAALASDVDKKGEIQVISFAVSFIDEKYIKEKPSIFKDSADLLFDIITNPLSDGKSFNKEYVEQEKVNLCDLIESKINDKAYYAMSRCIEEMCENEAYGLDELGDIKTISEIDENSLYEYYRNIFLKKLQVRVFVTGDVSKEDMDYTEKLFGNIGGADAEKINCAGELFEAGNEIRTITEKMDVLQGKLCMGFRTMTGISSPDYYDLTICNMILGGGVKSKLFQNVREKESLAYYAYSRLDKFKGIMVISAGIEANNREKAEKLILEQIDSVKNGDISDSEFEAAVNSYIGAVNQMNDGQRTLADFFLGQSLCGVEDTLEDIKTKVKRVTRESVAKAAEKIKPDTFYFLAPEEVSV